MGMGTAVHQAGAGFHASTVCLGLPLAGYSEVGACVCLGGCLPNSDSPNQTAGSLPFLLLRVELARW